jgi:hypothetical protein
MKSLNSPIYDISSLDQPIYISRPVAVVVNHACHLHNLQGIGIIAMQVAYRNYPARKRWDLPRILEMSEDWDLEAVDKVSREGEQDGSEREPGH